MVAYRHSSNSQQQGASPRLKVVATLNRDIDQAIAPSLKILGIMFKERVVYKLLERELAESQRVERERESRSQSNGQTSGNQSTGVSYS